MLACCPHCRHRFPVTDAEREAWGGRVRCDSCRRVFDIRMAGDEPPETPPEPAPEPESPLMIPAVLKDDLARAHAPPRSVFGTLAWSLACLVLILGLMAQLAYHQREWLLTHPELEPWVRQACDRLGCPLSPRTDPASLHLVGRQVHSHPGHPDALMITGRLENRADFPQPWPILELVFMDIMGNPVAARRFAPETYLVHPPEGLMPPTQPAELRLDVEDPGPAAVSYRFRFLAP